MLTSFLIYTCIFVIISLFFGLINKTDNKLGLTIVLMSSILLAIFASIREGVGTDFYAYRDIFYYVNNHFSTDMIFSFYQEPFNVILYRVGFIVFSSEKGMYFIYSFLTTFFVFITIYKFKNSINVRLSVFMFLSMFYLVSFNGMRQMLAVSILLYGFTKLHNKKHFIFIIICIISSLVHKSAMFMILLLPYVLIFQKSTIKQSLVRITAMTIVIVPIVSLISPTISNYLGVYESYFDSQGQSNVLFLLYIIPTILLYIIINYSSNKDDNSFIISDLFFKLYLLTIPFQFLGYFYAYFDRFSMYTSLTQIIALPALLRTIKLKETRLFLTVLVYSWSLFYHIIMFLLLKSNGVYPFYT